MAVDPKLTLASPVPAIPSSIACKAHAQIYRQMFFSFISRVITLYQIFRVGIENQMRRKVQIEAASDDNIPHEIYSTIRQASLQNWIISDRSY